jgi:hypothetical protein
VKEQGVWGVKRAKKFLMTDEAARQLDDEEERLATGRDPAPMDSFFEEDVTTVRVVPGVHSNVCCAI